FTQNVPGSLGGPGTLALQAYATGNFSSYTFFSNPHVTASNSTINLVGSFTTPQLSPFIGSGGLVNLIGTLNNLGNTFTLTAANDVWKLHGAVVGGTITEAGGSLLPAGGRLTGVTFNGDLDMAYDSVSLTISGGSVINGTITVGSSNPSGPNSVSS